jgi:hypothetical protein
MSISIVNRLGFFMALAAFGLAYALRLQWSWLSDAMLIALAASLCLALDVFWRVGKGKRKWFKSANGGSVLYMPLWLLGTVWLGMCAYQMYVGPIPAMGRASSLLTVSSSAAEQPEPAKAQATAKR